ncbi:MAG: LysR family transcriptional regulator [Rhizobiales bacterium]|nr:LysR family transcriptional regulator [Hyphomicrobiales bacterium]
MVVQQRTGLPWDDLKLVFAIGTAGTLSGGARRLGIDHSTAFRRLGALEARLGVRLFDRARDGYAATPAGEAIIREAARFDGVVEALERKLAGEDLRPSGTVRVTTTDTLLGVLAPELARFRTTHPGITVDLVVANAFLSLTKRDADVAIRPAAEVPENLTGRRLAGIATALYAGHDFRLADRRSLANENWIGLDETLSHLGSARWMAAEVAPERIVARADTLMAAHALAREGVGIAALPCYLADPDPRLKRLSPPIDAMSSSIWLLTHPDLKRVARIRAFLDFIATALTAHRRAFEGRPVKASG